MRAAPATVLLFFSLIPGALAQRRLAVVDLSTPPNMVALGAQVSRSVIKIAGEQKFKVVPPEELRTKLGDVNYRELLDCAERISCVASKLRALKVDRAVIGSLNRDDRSYLLRLWLLDLSTLTALAEVDKAVLIASRRLTHDVDAVVPGFLRGEQEPPGTLKLTVNVEKAEVAIDGEPAGVAPIARQLKPGKHQVRMVSSSYLPVERLVTIESGRITEEKVRLIRVPGAVSEPLSAPSLAQTPHRAPESGRGFTVPSLAWVAGGAGMAAVGAGIGFAMASRSLERNLNAGYDPATNSYSGIRRDAETGKRDALIANVLFGVAGAALATGAALTLLHNSGDGNAAKTTLSAAPGSGILVEGSF